MRIPALSNRGPNYLYTDTRDYIDLSVDENGLWGIYGLEETNNNTIVAKIDPVTLTVSRVVFTVMTSFVVYRLRIEFFLVKYYM